MSLTRNSTSAPDFEKEILFHISELRYHQDSFTSSLKEAAHHLKKFQEHDSLITELTNNFNSEVSYV